MSETKMRRGAVGGRSARRRPSIAEDAYDFGRVALSRLGSVDRQIRFMIRIEDFSAKRSSDGIPRPKPALSPADLVHSSLVRLREVAAPSRALEEVAQACLTTDQSHQVEAARLALLLRRIAERVIELVDEGDEDAAGNEVLHGLCRPGDDRLRATSIGRLCADESRAARVIRSVTEYLHSVDLPRLRAEMDAVRLKLLGPFVPTSNQRRLCETLDKHGPTKRRDLARLVGTASTPSNLERRFDLDQLIALEFVGPGDGGGYVLLRRLPSLGVKRRRT